MIDSILNYLSTRPFWLKILDVVIVMIVAFSLSASYILATNFRSIVQLNRVNDTYAEFEQTSKAITRIKIMMDKIQTELNASRVGVYQFHNGTMGLGGIPFFFYSQSYEKTAPGISQELLNQQHVPLSIDHDLLGISNGSCYFNEKIDPSTANGHMLKTRGTQAYARCPIFNLDQKLVGFISIEYTDADKAPAEKVLLSRLKTFSDQIVGAMIGIENHK